jgi:hypothetical protein
MVGIPQDTWEEADMLAIFYYIYGSDVYPFLVEIGGAEGSIQNFFEDPEKVETRLMDESCKNNGMEDLEWSYLDSLEDSWWEYGCDIVDDTKDNSKKACILLRF